MSFSISVRGAPLGRAKLTTEVGVEDHTISNFDFQSLNLALNQELIELDLFHNGLAKVTRRFGQAAIAELI